MSTDYKVSLFFESSFDDALNFREKCKKIVNNLLNPTSKAEKEGEALKDQQQAAEMKQVGRDVTFSVSCRVH